MRKNLRGIKALLLNLFVAVTLGGPATSLHSQSNDLTLGALELPLVTPESVPQTGTFYLLSSLGTNGLGPPWPFNPVADQGVDTFWLGSNTFGNAWPGSFIVDDSAIDYQALNASMSMNSPEPPPSPGDGDPVEDGPVPDAYSYASNSFWIEILSATGGVASLVLHGTVGDIPYEVLSRQSLTNGINTNWISEGIFAGVVDQDWTPATVAIGIRTNSLFLWARSWIDEDGDGLPSWWETEWGLDPLNPDTGDTGIPDGYKNRAGDGWDNYYKYRHGMDPTQLYTPRPPQNVAARADATASTVVLTWVSGGGPVTNYVIYAGFYGLAASQFSSIGQASPSTFSFTNAPDCALIGGNCPQPVYFIRAYFANGSYADSQQAGPYKESLNPEVLLVRGPLGQRYLTVASPPPNLSRILLFWDKPDFTTGSLSIYSTNLVNGIAQVPAMEGYGDADIYGFQLVATNGDFGEMFSDYPYPSSEWAGSRASKYGFVDARRHLKENLRFLLRSATVNRPFSYTSNLRTDSATHTSDAEPYFVMQPEAYYARPASPTSYEYYGFHYFSSNLDYSVIQELRPVQENFLWRNFVFDVGDYDLTGASFYSDPPTYIRTLTDPLHVYSGSGTETNLSLAFAATNSDWLYFRWVSNNPSDADANTETGLSVDIFSHKLELSSSARNAYGLTFDSVYVANSGVSDTVVQPNVPSTYAAAYA